MVVHRRNFFAGLLAALAAIKAGRSIEPKQPRFDDFLIKDDGSFYLDKGRWAYIESIHTDMGDYWQVNEYVNGVHTQSRITPKQPGSIQFSVYGGGSADT